MIHEKQFTLIVMRTILIIKYHNTSHSVPQMFLILIVTAVTITIQTVTIRKIICGPELDVLYLIFSGTSNVTLLVLPMVHKHHRHKSMELTN